MTGLCRLIRGCAAPTAGPFVPPSERRKLAVLIPLFMSSREKRASTLQPCPLHPFRGQAEGAPALSSRRRGLPSRSSMAAGLGEGVAVREPQWSASGKWGQRPHQQRILVGGGREFILMN